MVLTQDVAYELDRILNLIKSHEDNATDRSHLYRILQKESPNEIDIFMARRGIPNRTILLQQLKARDARELASGLAILGAALLTIYLITRIE